MASLTIEGNPLVTFQTQLDSWNEAIEMANKRPYRVKSWAHARAPFNAYTQAWREHGEYMAKEFLEKACWDLLFTQPYLIRKRAMVIVKVARATERTYDVHNAYVKAVFDGFSDAGIWKDDNWKYVPWVLYGWVHMSNIDEAFVTGDNVFLIELYELDRVTISGVPYILPNFMEVL